MKLRVPPALQPFLPARPLPIILIGAGGIMRDAHLPAYQIANFEMAGIYDPDLDRAQRLASDFKIATVFHSFEQAVAPKNAVFDIAIPASKLLQVVERLPPRSVVLLQKPMGESFEQAGEILQLCRGKELIAAVNFQLRFAPFILAAQSLIKAGIIGELLDLEVRVTVATPWHRWPFMLEVPQFEILYHSIHYLDLLRSLLGEPRRIQAQAFARHPTGKFGTTIIFDAGENVRALITTNHSHRFGIRHQESYIKWEGTKGAIKAQMGLLMNYPIGESDYLELGLLESADSSSVVWRPIPCEGTWFPHAFIGTMGSLQRFVGKESAELPTSVEDAILTMAAADAAIRSSRAGGEPVRKPEFLCR